MTKLTMMALAMAAILCVTSASCTADDTQFCVTTVYQATCAVKTGGTNPNCQWLDEGGVGGKFTCPRKDVNNVVDGCKRCKVKAGGTNENCAKAFPFSQSCTIASGLDPKLPPKLPFGGIAADGSSIVNLCAVKAGGTNKNCAGAKTKAMCTSAGINKKISGCAVKAGGTNPSCQHGGTSIAGCNTMSTLGGVTGAANACELKTTDVGAANVCEYTDKNECIYTGYTESACTAKSNLKKYVSCAVKAGGTNPHCAGAKPFADPNTERSIAACNAASTSDGRISGAANVCESKTTDFGAANACVFTAASETTVSRKFKDTNCMEVRVPTCVVKAGGTNPHCASVKLTMIYKVEFDIVKYAANCNAASTSGSISGAANVCEYKLSSPGNGASMGYSCDAKCAVKAGGTNPVCPFARSKALCNTYSTGNVHMPISGAANVCEWIKIPGQVVYVSFFDLFGDVFMFVCYFFVYSRFRN